MIDKLPPDSAEPIVSARMSRKDLRTFFYLFTSRPDSVFKPFFKPIVVKQEDLTELNDSICEKLKLHSIEAVNAKIQISLSKNKLLEFGSWGRFIGHKFKESDSIASLVIRWDFLINLSDYGNRPLPHSMSLRISNDLSPIQMLRAVFSGEGDINDIEDNVPPCLLKIDSIHPQLADEMINVVKEWIDGRRKAIIEKPFLQRLRKRNKFVSSFVHFLIPAVVSLVSISIFIFNYLIATDIKDLLFKQGITLYLSFFGIYIFHKLGLKLADSVSKKLRSLGKLPIFQITNGDKLQCDEIEKSNIKHKRSLIWTFILELIIGIGGSLIATIIWVKILSP